MRPLTLAYARENLFFATDYIKYFKPHWTDEECDYYLWEKTCYPFSTEKLIEQLNEQLIEPEQHAVVGC